MELLSMGNKAFADTRIKLDAMLNALVNSLIEKGLSSGTVGLRIKVEMETKVTDDGEVIYVPQVEPKVSMKIGGSGSIDCFVPKGLVLKRSGDGRMMACENQINMDDVMKEEKGA